MDQDRLKGDKRILGESDFVMDVHVSEKQNFYPFVRDYQFVIMIRSFYIALTRINWNSLKVLDYF